MNELLERTLKYPYNKENFLHLANHIFKDFDRHEVDLSDLVLNSSEKEKVQSFSLLGKAKVDSKYIYVLDVELKRNVESSPIFQRNIISKFLKRDFSDIAFVAYHTQGEKKWKIALVRVDYKNNEILETRRFYYVVGNEEVHTPMEALSKLFDRENTISDLLEAFSIEKVTKEFFEDVAYLFYELVGGSIERKNKTEVHKKLLVLPHIDDQKTERVFAIKLLSRLIFAWFLKKKGLISDDILSSKALSDYKEKVPMELRAYDSYYHSVLEPLFFEVLNKRKEERELVFLRSDLFKDIPFLNGGIFDPKKDEDFYDKEQKDLIKRANLGLKIQDDWFKNLFELFERYNFTVDESTPIDIDISIDPEMLGRIFENLLAEINEETQETARKATGSYYTPREIVDFMVTESLKYYLEDKTSLSKDEIESLLSYQEEETHLSESKKKEVIDAVDKIKIIDPACGSGAFPMGILQKLILILKKVDPDNKFWIEKKLGKIDDPALREVEKEKWLKEKEETNYLRKLGLLRDSIYGVDIQPYATEISRLRAFLTLIVDKHVDKNKENYGVDPLPNLDFKFVTANSLIDVEKIENTNSKTNEFFYDTFYNELEELTNEYFYSFDPAKKEKVRQKIEKLINDKVENKKQEILDMKKSLANNINKKLSNKQKELEEKYSYEMVLWESYKNIFKDKPVEFFNVKYFFPSAKDGFDIVIANPPYIQLQKDGGKLGNLYKDKGFETFDRTGDIYCLFYEKSVELLKAGGILTYISSNKWMRAGYGKKLRRFFLKHEPLLLIDLGPDVFENATVDTSILVLRKGRDTNKKIACKGVTLDKNNRNAIEVFVKEKAFELTYLNEYAKDNEKMGSQWFVGNSVEKQLKEKIERIGKPLKDWDVKIYRGILTGLNEAFIIDSKKREEILNNCKDEEERKRTEAIIKPILRGRDIGRYYYEWKGLWVIVIPAGWTNEKRGYKDAERFIKEQFSSLMIYLQSFEEKAKKRDDQGDYWWELRHCSYYPEFEKEKIINKSIGKNLSFSLDSMGMFAEASCYITTGSNIKYILGVLNSNIVKYLIYKYADRTGAGDIAIKVVFWESLPIPPITSDNEDIVKQIESLVDKILDVKKKDKDSDTSEYERQIDELVYKLYDLTPEEIAIIENSFKNNLT